MSSALALLRVIGARELVSRPDQAGRQGSLRARSILYGERSWKEAAAAAVAFSFFQI